MLQNPPQIGSYMKPGELMHEQNETSNEDIRNIKKNQTNSGAEDYSNQIEKPTRGIQQHTSLSRGNN